MTNRPLDVRIAREVFGWADVRENCSRFDWGGIPPEFASRGGATRVMVPHYSNNMLYAGKILDALEGEIHMSREYAVGWIVEFSGGRVALGRSDGTDGMSVASLAHAICQARLQ